MFKNVIKEEVTFPAQMNQLGKIRRFVENIGKLHRFNENIINPFRLVIDEACTNIIRHGYRDVTDGEIVIRAIVRRLSLTIVIIDQGISYDPRQAHTPDLGKYVDIGKKGGLGILMIRKLMDDIQYTVTENGNEFRLTKYREKANETTFKNWLYKLNLKTKYSIAASFIFFVIVLLFFVPMHLSILSNVQNEALNVAISNLHNLAENSKEDLMLENDHLLFEKAHSTFSNNKELFSKVVIVKQDKSVISWTDAGIVSAAEPYIPPPTNALIDTIENVYIFHYAPNDSVKVYELTTEVLLRPGVAIGSVSIVMNDAKINNLAESRKFNLVLISLSILIIGFLALYLLVSKILSSFQNLAGWVRQVVRGKVDQDEIDIDASDELGEIAQAFKEMTNKFREAQVTLIEQQKLQKELQVAQEIQQMLLPSDFPEVEGYEIASYYEAAKEVGGDLFDFVEIDDHSIGVCVADVSGKGVPGSMIMTMIRTALRLESRGNKNPADVLARVNRFVADDMKRGMFVTMFYMVLDSRKRVIHYASAGHNPMILYRGSSQQTYYLNPTGFPVGIKLPDTALFDKKIETDSIRLREDDVLILYTDGVTEAMNHKRELYRDERFLTAIRENSSNNVGDFVQNIYTDIKNFTGGATQNDDITFVAVRERMMQGEVLYSIHKELTDLIESGVKVKDALKELQVSSHFYYKYKEIVERKGWEGLKEFLDQSDILESKQLSIETKTKIFDIVRKHPDFGAARIATELKNAEYGNLKIDSGRIYKELKKLRLNTEDMRKRFIEKGGRGRVKQPGTPLLTLDGNVILDFESSGPEITKGGKNMPPAAQEKQSPIPPTEQKTEKPFVMLQNTPANIKVSEAKPRPAKATPAPKIAASAPAVQDHSRMNITDSISREDLLNSVKLNINLLDLNHLFNGIKDDIYFIEEQVDTIGEIDNIKMALKKISMTMKTIISHPSLQTLPDVKKIFIPVKDLFEMMYENSGRIKTNITVSLSKDLLYYLKKDNKFTDQQKYYETINKLGFLQKKLERKLLVKTAEKNNEMDLLRKRLAKSNITKRKVKLKSEPIH
jgi:serine phosphatase RsbU (regulator of sigma subunit)/anti-sigma regulatory factor (Ser/Thr protein kinase)